MSRFAAMAPASLAEAAAAEAEASVTSAAAAPSGCCWGLMVGACWEMVAGEIADVEYENEDEDEDGKGAGEGCRKSAVYGIREGGRRYRNRNRNRNRLLLRCAAGTELVAVGREGKELLQLRCGVCRSARFRLGGGS